MNLRSDGPHLVADTALVKIRATHEPHVVWVGPTGIVTLASLRKSWRRETPPPDSDLVGIYTKGATSQAIREDLQARMKEINAASAA